MDTIHTNEVPDWLLMLGPIIGAEGDGPDASGSDGDSGSDSSQSESDSDDSGDDASGDDDIEQSEEFKQLPEDHPIKKALRAERAARKQDAKERKREARELARLRAQLEEDEAAKKGELEQERLKRERAEEKNQRLAAGYLRSALDREIERAARDAKFRDTDDALQLVDRSLITYEQDEDDPSEVDIDRKTVQQAVKKLADRKKHLIASGTEDDEPTGSRFGGPRKKSRTSEEALRQKYPGL